MLDDYTTATGRTPSLCLRATPAARRVVGRPLSGVAYLALLLSTSGCPSPNTYATPRTVAPGNWAHSFAIEGLSVIEKKQGESKEGGGSLVPLAYTLRTGLTENTDVGVRFVPLLPSGGVDVKWNPVRGWIDLAFDPGVQIVRDGGKDSGGFFHLPLLLGLNLSDQISLLFSAGMTLGLGGARFSYGWEKGEFDMARAFVRGGLGLNWRASKRFAIQPELTVLQAPDESRAVIVVGGVGFNVGSLPTF